MRSVLYILLALLIAGSIGCDTVEPVDSSTLVVEGFLDTGERLPEIRLRRTLPPNRGYSETKAAVRDASLDVVIAGNRIAYDPDDARPGIYVPSAPDVRPAAGEAYALNVTWQDATVRATGTLPAEVRIRDIELDVPDEPVSAVLLDSLLLSDTLATGAYTGYIYPVEVTVHWDGEQVDPGESWVRLQLKPYATFSSSVVDLFLKSGEILRENEQPLDAFGKRSWTGVYAVGVARADEPLPEHRLRVSVVRSGADYARFAASKDAPERREPVSNLVGAAGIFAAISVDSLHVRVGKE